MNTEEEMYEMKFTETENKMNDLVSEYKIISRCNR